MSSRQSTTPGRIARAIVAATVLGAALSGCAVTIEGAPHANPVALSAPRTSAPATPAPRSEEYRTPPTTSRTPSLSAGEPLAPHAPVLARWAIRGWRPLPLVRVTDPRSGVSAAMFGQAQTKTDDDGDPYFESKGAPAGILSTFSVVPTTRDAEDAVRAHVAENGGRLVSSERSVVDGRAVHDAVIDIPTSDGSTVRQVARSVQLPGRVVLLQTIGGRSDAETVDEAHGIFTSTLRIP